jgi:hypothetical protein
MIFGFSQEVKHRRMVIRGTARGCSTAVEVLLEEASLLVWPCVNALCALIANESHTICQVALESDHQVLCTWTSSGHSGLHWF